MLATKLHGVKRVPYNQALKAASTTRHDFVGHYLADLANVVDLERIKAAKLRLGVDPLGGAAVAYWRPLAERYGLDLHIVNESVDPTFRFMTLDWDGKIRMDCSSPTPWPRSSNSKTASILPSATTPIPIAMAL